MVAQQQAALSSNAALAPVSSHAAHLQRTLAPIPFVPDTERRHMRALPLACPVCKGMGFLAVGTPCLACATLGEVFASPAIFAQQIIEIQGAERADLSSVRWLADAIDEAAHIEQWDRDAWLEVFDAVAYWRDLYMKDAAWWDHAARRCLARITAMLAAEVRR